MRADSRLHLGTKNIRLGPTMPAFISPNVLNYLAENFSIAPITTPEEDLKQLLILLGLLQNTPIKKPHRPSQKGLADVVFCVRIKLP